MREVKAPWLLKPRMNASAIGIKPILHEDDLWPVLDTLGDLQSYYVLEQFVSGEVFHVEGVTWNGRVLCSIPNKYGRPPMETMHEGGVFTTRNLPLDSADGMGLVEIHTQLLEGFGLESGVTHSEFIKAAADGRFYFLETAARVGGAYIADMVEFATGVNPWVEWARIEVALARGEEYTLATPRQDFAGSIISLARQDEPDLSGYTDPEIALRLHKPHHAGIIVTSHSGERVAELVESYARRFLDDFCAVIPPPDKPTS
jgi:biotin carboxylase